MDEKDRRAEYQRKRVVYRVRSLLFSIFVWEIAVALYMVLRTYGAMSAEGQVTGVTAAYVTLVAGFLLGVTDWFANTISDTRSFRSRSYGFLIAFKGICLLISVVLIIFCARFGAVSAGIIERGDVLASFIERLTDKTMIPALLFVVSAAVAFSFIRQMITQVGGRVLLNLMLGKYRYPKQEKRIFMFLDMKSSTTIAERLGHVKFSRLLQDCFEDLTDSAIKHDVEIYLYVGDEAVLTWKEDDGIRNSNCISAYYDFQAMLQGKAEYYNGKYGVVPEFKAGVNAGSVTVAEIGVIKKHIAYHGDVLNTAARMEGKCNEYGKALLASESLKELLPGDQTLSFELMGNIPLRGKKHSADIYSVEVV